MSAATAIQRYEGPYAKYKTLHFEKGWWPHDGITNTKAPVLRHETPHGSSKTGMASPVAPEPLEGKEKKPRFGPQEEEFKTKTPLIFKDYDDGLNGTLICSHESLNVYNSGQLRQLFSRIVQQLFPHTLFVYDYSHVTRAGCKRSMRNYLELFGSLSSDPG